jgi:hypothetical protein
VVGAEPLFGVILRSMSALLADQPNELVLANRIAACASGLACAGEMLCGMPSGSREPLPTWLDQGALAHRHHGAPGKVTARKTRSQFAGLYTELKSYTMCIYGDAPVTEFGLPSGGC